MLNGTLEDKKSNGASLGDVRPTPSWALIRSFVRTTNSCSFAHARISTSGAVAVPMVDVNQDRCSAKRAAARG